jgi:hypothetical protein
MELMSEGKMGWGLNFPCWRINNKFIKLFINKELTGYHFYLLLVFLTVFHSPFLFIDYSLQKELICLGAFFYYWIAEDFLWFAENGIYGIRNFRAGRIFWHKRWFIGLPVSYWTGIIIGTALLILGGLK